MIGEFACGNWECAFYDADAEGRGCAIERVETGIVLVDCQERPWDGVSDDNGEDPMLVYAVEPMGKLRGAKFADHYVAPGANIADATSRELRGEDF